MRILPYYLFHTFINSIKKLFKTWVAIVVIICLGFGLIGGIIGATVGSVVEDSEVYEEETEEDFAEEPLTEQDIREMNSFFKGITFLIALAVILGSIYSGDKNGTKIFTMPDVNFLFASPLKPQSVLMFRTVLQMGLAIVSSLYLLFQLPNLVLNVGLSILVCFCIFTAYIFLLYYSRLASVLAYTASSSNAKLKRLVKPFVFAVIVIIGALYLNTVKTTGLDYFKAALHIFSFKYLEYIPVFGWLSGLIMASIEKNLLKFIIYLVLNILGSVIFTFLIWKIKADFYEDALSGAAMAQEQLEAAKGNQTAKRKKDRKQSIKRNSEFNTEGALIFFEKTLYNRKRFAKFGIFTNTAITYTLISLSVSAALKLIFKTDTVLPIGFILLVMIFFRNMGNPLEDEMNHTLIYTMPESPFKKLWCSMLGGFSETALDLLPVFVITAAAMPNEALKLIKWYILWVSLDVFCSSVGLFTNMILPSSLNQNIIVMFAIFIRMFAIVPGLMLVIIGAALNQSLLIYLTVFLNLSVGCGLSALSPIFLHNGKK